MAGYYSTAWEINQMKKDKSYKRDRIIVGIFRILLTPIAFIYALYLFTWVTIQKHHGLK